MNAAPALEAEPQPREIPLDDEAATARLAARVAGVVRPRDVIALAGPLGAGKTAFARAFLGALARRRGVAPPDDVPSPTFTLVQTYALGGAAVWHFDLYRLSRPDDAVELGLDEALADGISLIEWPERLGRLMPPDRLEIALAYAGADRPHSRRVRLTGHGSWAGRVAHVA